MGNPDSSPALLAAKAAHDRAGSPRTALALAAAHRRAGDAQAAIAVLAPLVAALPNAWGLRFELGLALAMTGDREAGLAELDRAIALNPRSTLARHAALDLRALGDAEGEDQQLDGLHDPALRDTVAILLDGGSPAAGADLRKRFSLDIEDVAAACLIADVGVRLGSYDGAAELLRGAVDRAPAYVPARFRLAEALHRAERDEEALAVLDWMPQQLAQRRAILALSGAIHLRLGLEESAIRDLRSVATAADAGPGAHIALGHALRFVGRRDEAMATYRRAIAIDPDCGDAYWSISNLKNASFAPEEIAVMEVMEARTDLADEARAQIGFALGRAREQDGAFARAFAHYRRANALRRTTEAYDPDAQDRFVDRMIAVCEPEFFVARTGSGDPAIAPIFVVGMPRSGSTLVEQILASHSAVEGLSELPEVTRLARTIMPYPEGMERLPADAVAQLGATYLARVGTRRRTGAPRFVDKLPGNVFHIGLIHLMLPNARIIVAQRDARDCCMSLFTQSFAAGQAYSYDLGDLGRHYAGYERLMRHFVAMLPERVLRVDYETLVDDLEGQTRRLLDHCDLPFEPGCLRFFENERAVRTPSSEQVRQPIYRGSIGRWRNFEPWLGPLLNALPASEAAAIVTPR